MASLTLCWCRLATFAGSRGCRHLWWPPKASTPPYALFIFPKTRKHFDAVRAEPRLWQGFLMLQRTHFLYVKMSAICSNARFWTFNPSIYVYDLRRHFDGCDAGSALVRDPMIWCNLDQVCGCCSRRWRRGDRLMIGTGYVAIYA